MRLLEVDFAGKKAKLDPAHGEDTPAMQEAMDEAALMAREEINAAGTFLKEHETARIIVVIDTHCLEENGLLVYSDADAQNLDACTLETVGVMQA